MFIVAKPFSVVCYEVGTNGSGVVTKHALFAVLFEAEVDDTFGVIVFKTCEFGHIALLVNDLYFFDHVGRDILGGGLYVVTKEFLSVDAYAFDFLAVDGHFALFVHLHAVHLLEQFLDGGCFAHLVGSGVVLYGITLDGHFCGFALHADFG